MPPTEPTNFYFKDIVHLDGRELMQLMRALGLEELGAAFLTVASASWPSCARGSGARRPRSWCRR